MRDKLTLLFAVLILGSVLAPAVKAQTFTTVTGTIVDPAGVPYAGGNVNAVITPPGPPSPTITATHAPVNPVPGRLDDAGHFSIILAANASITPNSTHWAFTICAPPVQPPTGTGNSCFRLTGVTISGASQDISTAANALALPLLNQYVVYHTAHTATTGSISAVTMATAPAGGGTYDFDAYLTETVVGMSCSTTSTVTVSINYTDPNESGAASTVLLTGTVSTNGALGRIPVALTSPLGLTFRAKAGTTVNYLTTATPDSMCSPAITYQVYPVLRLLTK